MFVAKRIKLDASRYGIRLAVPLPLHPSCATWWEHTSGWLFCFLGFKQTSFRPVQMQPLLILLIIIPHPLRSYEQRWLRYDDIYLKEHQPGGDRQMPDGPHGRHAEHIGTHSSLEPGTVSVLSCLTPCSESITIFFVLWLHFASTCKWHFFHYTVLDLVSCFPDYPLRQHFYHTD